jgi:hypothetical protein
MNTRFHIIKYASFITFFAHYLAVDPVVLSLAKNTTVDLSGLDKETTPDGDKISTHSAIFCVTCFI